MTSPSISFSTQLPLSKFPTRKFFKTLNNVPLKFLEPKNAEKTFELADGFEFQGDINVMKNVSAVMKNVFLAGDRNTIRGNFILQNAVSVDNLAVKSLMEVPVENLMSVNGPEYCG
jgi:hypothetical protein